MQEVYWSLAWKTNNGNYVPLGQRECHWKLRCKWIADTGPQILTSDLTSLDFERLYKIAGQTHPANNLSIISALQPASSCKWIDYWQLFWAYITMETHLLQEIDTRGIFLCFYQCSCIFHAEMLKNKPFNSLVLKLCKTLNRPDYSISLPAAKECVIQNWKLQH